MKINYSAPPIKDALVLATYALAVGFTLMLIQQCTADVIKDNEHKALRQTIQAVLATQQYNNDPVVQKQTLADGNNTHRDVYPAFDGSRPVAVAIKASAPDGYAGQINMLVGVSYDGIVSGVRVLSHRETPGLGDKIDADKSQWIIEFNGSSLSKTRIWKVRKDGGDFDQFTGATITPRAVVNAVRQTLEWYSNNRQQIFE